MSFCNVLKQLRLSKGLTQVEIANTLGIAKSTYSLYESGNREPNMSMMKKIAEYFGVSMDYLMEMNTTPQTLAAHFDGDEYTEEELDKIKEFADFVKSKRTPKVTDMFQGVGKMSSDLLDHLDKKDK